MGAVHIEKLVEVSEKQKLSILKILIGSFKSRCLKKHIKIKDNISRLPTYGVKLAKPLSALKFLSFIDKDGYPIILPVMQSKVLDVNHIGICNNVNTEIIDMIPNGSKVAMFVANFSLVSLMIQGT
jgi:hypothetical protein